MDKLQLRNLKTEAEAWENSINEEDATPIEKAYTKINDPWYARLGFAVSYIFLSKMIMEWMTESDDDDIMEV
ncbi:hypothetical protein [Sanyastnella coralliicola]|uniref:hypothetical protein n=1 Tax=Sanyastnella coralliicola TaxID=3069118 RepID=UPI0027B9E72F|nr:hypothetical protein [Longitalea sp. SCSIO 12813]